MRVRSFSHAGITVSDFDRAVEFYRRVFGCLLLTARDVPPERVRGAYGVGGAARCRIGLLRVPGGALLEIFAFDPSESPAPLAWNRPAVTHLAFNVRGIDAWHARLAGEGVPCDAAPVRMPGGPSFFYARDPDGTLIELVEAGWRLRFLGAIAPLLKRRA